MQVKHRCIIGGTGFIGSHLIHRLIEDGGQLTVIGRNASPTRLLPGGVRYLAGDYGDHFFLNGALQEIDEIITLAYTTVPQSSFEDPVQDIISNLPATVKLFDIAVNLNIQKLVFVSSGGTVYGRAKELPINEDHPTNPISPYGITKLATEKYAMMFHDLKGLPVICVRPSNAYGDGQLPFVGQGFIATAIASILKRQEIVLFGENGTVRDYIHVSDVASGILGALKGGRPGQCYNIGSKEGRDNREILNALIPLARSAGLEPSIRILPHRLFDVPANVLDSSKLKRETNWAPLVPFDEGIKKTWDWFLKRFP